MKKILLSMLIFPLLCFSTEKKGYDPWYTGPILADSAKTLSYGQFYVQPYLYVLDSTGRYNTAWGHQSGSDELSTQIEVQLQIGLIDWMDITFDAYGGYNKESNKEALVFGDSSVKLGFKLLKDKKGSWEPNIRFVIREYFPTGRYQKLNPDKYGIDASGTGAYETDFGLRASKIVYWLTWHPMKFTFNIDYKIPTKVDVKGFNSYGGGYNTDGKVSPGNNFTFIFSIEFSFTQRWVYTMDIAQSYNDPVKFSGIAGTATTGQTASNTAKSSSQTSLTPGLEYNFNKNLGIVGGAWFSVFEKNSSKFKGGVLSLAYSF